jgi:hypothetical protein
VDRVTFFLQRFKLLSRSMLDSGAAFMTKILIEAKAILENMLQNHN